ncbi:MAG: AgmX/PglI C-terminal domain-containing protein [Bdellovibrionaceae bacterium]|nr:AgmX/PglI C-terminal domain-containing protein [Pseudobdellovibrionaceae bacterium]
MKNGILGAFLVFVASASPAYAKSSGPTKLDTASVKALVKSKMLEVQKCYTDLIIEGMAKAGTVAVTWKIDDQGAVQELTITNNTAKDQALGGCVTEKVQNWIFPAAEAGQTFSASYTFKFGS